MWCLGWTWNNHVLFSVLLHHSFPLPITEKRQTGHDLRGEVEGVSLVCLSKTVVKKASEHSCVTIPILICFFLALLGELPPIRREVFKGQDAGLNSLQYNGRRLRYIIFRILLGVNGGIGPVPRATVVKN